MLFYERGILSQNKDLIEIKDKKILNELAYQYKKDYLTYRTSTPLISGTVVTSKNNQGIFERKLKMLRAPIFSLLAVCQCKEFADKEKQVETVKNGIIRYLKTDAYEILEQMDVLKVFGGWQHIINDIALNNELTDVRPLNFPELNAYNLVK